MTEIREYIDKNTNFFSIEFTEGLEGYFLLFDAFSDWAEKFCEYFQKLKQFRVTRSQDSKNLFYFTCDTFNKELKLEDVKLSDKALIQNICKTHFTEKAFLVKDERDKYFINFNLEFILKNENLEIMGIFLNPLDDFISFLEANKDKIEVKSVNKFNDVTISEVILGDEIQENENLNAQQEQENPEGNEANEDKEAQEENLEEENEADAGDFNQDFDDFEEEKDLQLNEKVDQDKAKKKRKKIRSSSIEEEFMETQKGGRRKKDQIDENKAREEVLKFQAKLREAIEIDRTNMQRNQPAIEKLKLVNIIQKFLSNYHFQKIFLECQGLEILQDWIKKNRDGSYPVFNQISVILEVLDQLPVSVTNLRNCAIGSYVMDLKEIKESKQIQKKASELIEKWSRIVWDINTNYSDFEAENKHYKAIFSNRKRQRDLNFMENEDNENRFNESNKSGNYDNIRNRNEVGNLKEKAKNLASSHMNEYSHAKIPKKALFDFIVKPDFNENDFSHKQSVMRSKFVFGEKKKSGRQKGE